MRMLILIPEFIAGIMGCLSMLNGSTLFNLFNYYVALGVLGNLRGMITGITDVVMMFYCWDVYHAFKISRAMGAFTPCLVKHWYGLPLILGIGAAMIGLDQYTSYLSVRGLAGATSVLGSAVVALIYIIGVVILVCLGFKVSKEVAVSQGAAGGVERAGNGVTPLSVMINSVLLLRKYMLMSTIGRIMAISGVLMYVSGLMFTNPFMFVLSTLVLVGVGGLLSSTAQVLIAVEITPSTRRSAVVSTAGGDSRIRGANRVAPAPV